MRAALLVDLLEQALSSDPSSEAGVRVEMPNLCRVVYTYSMGGELDEAGGVVPTVEEAETPYMPEWGEVD